MISRLKRRADLTSHARIVTRTSTSRPCAHTSKTSTLANLKSPYDAFELHEPTSHIA
ncbi:unnamed protein product [Prunus armeniaca]|uniref:Uncharacterized protein n=1 Tax=Prunus armeniaca TaxID=36596 RepID=A0A6J5XTC1_PRUAR|nr:unnamed protein product [Prunus armeniaca]CAB4316351.1 unnamed protein product [Prunus armeniaca]